jgi:nucleoside-diphosphate-sugar epimerase
MRVLITGGTGFIGSRLALASLESGESVRVLGQANNAWEVQNVEILKSRGVEVVLASVTEKGSLAPALASRDVVYHLAAAQHEANISDQVFHDVNVTGTRNLLEASVEAGIGRFVYGSTIGVYGDTRDTVLDERSPLRPANIYGVTKQQAEEVVGEFQDRLSTVVVRIGETYGPGDRRLLKLFRAIDRNVFFVIGGGENLHSLIYVDDLVHSLRAAAVRETAVGQTLVVAGETQVTTNEMVRTIAEQLGRRVPAIHAPLWPFLVAAWMVEGLCRPLGFQPPLHRRRMDFFRRSFSFSQIRARECLGHRTGVSFCSGVAETAGWYRQTGHL